ncbi:MAG: hypothetical protein EAS52_14615, partial [Parapedobacter sp.]
KAKDDQLIRKYVLGRADTHYPQWLGEPRGECLESIREVPMMVVNDRKDAWPLLARRHGMGMIKWDNYGKASFFQHISDSYTVPDYQLANHVGVGRRELRGFLMPNRLINAAEGRPMEQKPDGREVDLLFACGEGAAG